MILDHCEVVTRTDSISRDEWLEFRRQGIGGSDVSGILGKSRYKSRESILASKLRAVNDKTGPAARWGQLLERAVAQAYAEQTGSAVVAWPVLLRSKAHPFMLANVDFFIVEPSVAHPIGVTEYLSTEIPALPATAILEIKTTGIVGRGNKAGWADNHVPTDYELQGAHYSAVTGLVRVVFACLAPPLGLLVREREYEDNGELVARESEFWYDVERKRAAI